MKSKAILTIALLLMTFSIIFVSCKKDTVDTPAPVRVDLKTDTAIGEIIPQEAVFFFSIDWDAIAKLELFKEELDEAKKSFSTELGVDIFENLQQISIGILDFEDDFEKSAIIVFNGKFNEAEIINAIREQEDVSDIIETEYNNTTIYTPQDIDDSEFSFAFLGKDSVVLSHIDLLKKSIDVKAGKSPSLNKNIQMTDALRGIRRGAHISGVGILTEEMKSDIAQDPMSASMANIDVLTLSLLLDPAKTEIQLTGICASEEKAKELFNTLNGLWEGMAKPMITADPDYKDYADAIKIEHRASSTILTITLTEEQIEGLTALAGGFGMGDPSYDYDYDHEGVQ